MSIKKFYNIGKYQMYPLCRSLSGSGTLETLKIIKKNFKKFKIKKFDSQKRVFDWKVPSQWEIRDAYILDKFNKKIVNFKNNNLHVVGYSIPINKTLNLLQLKKKIYSLPKQTDAIPYMTSYYNKDWGFCVTDKFKRKLLKKYKKNDKFKVVIKSKLKSRGKINYGEYLIKGKSKKEILISTYICHPSLANDNLSGIIVSMALMKYFETLKNQLDFYFYLKLLVR